MPGPALTLAPLLCRVQPGGTFLACSAPLNGTALSVLQAAGGYVSPFGYPSSTSFSTNKVSAMCGATSKPLPMGSGGNPIALTMNGQVIDVVRAAPLVCPQATVPLVRPAHVLTLAHCVPFFR